MPATANTTVADTYLKLINEFPLRRIRTFADHTKAKKLVLRLSIQQADRGTAEYLDVLVDLIADFEKQSGQATDTARLSAADLVRHRIEERGMSVSSLSRLIGVPQSNLSDMINGKRDWSKAAIRGLCSRLNMRADRFLT